MAVSNVRRSLAKRSPSAVLVLSVCAALFAGLFTALAEVRADAYVMCAASAADEAACRAGGPVTDPSLDGVGGNSRFVPGDGTPECFALDNGICKTAAQIQEILDSINADLLFGGAGATIAHVLGMRAPSASEIVCGTDGWSHITGCISRGDGSAVVVDHNEITWMDVAGVRTPTRTFVCGAHRTTVGTAGGIHETANVHVCATRDELVAAREAGQAFAGPENLDLLFSGYCLENPQAVNCQVPDEDLGRLFDDGYVDASGRTPFSFDRDLDGDIDLCDNPVTMNAPVCDTNRADAGSACHRIGSGGLIACDNNVAPPGQICTRTELATYEVGSPEVTATYWDCDILVPTRFDQDQELLPDVSTAYSCPLDSDVLGRQIDFGASRPGGRQHEGHDLFAERGAPVYAVVSGTVVQAGVTNGNSLTILGDDGREYLYLHLDTLAAGVQVGARVGNGAVVGTNGDTGSARGTGHHIHFEMRQPGGPSVNPWNIIDHACWEHHAEGTRPAAPGQETWQTGPQAQHSHG